MHPRSKTWQTRMLLKMASLQAIDWASDKSQEGNYRIQYGTSWLRIFLMKCFVIVQSWAIPVNNCLLKVNNRNTRKRHEICSNLAIKTPEQRQQRRSGVFIVLLLLNLNKQIFSGYQHQQLDINDLRLTKISSQKFQNNLKENRIVNSNHFSNVLKIVWSHLFLVFLLLLTLNK